MKMSVHKGVPSHRGAKFGALTEKVLGLKDGEVLVCECDSESELIQVRANATSTQVTCRSHGVKVAIRSSPRGSSVFWVHIYREGEVK